MRHLRIARPVAGSLLAVLLALPMSPNFSSRSEGSPATTWQAVAGPGYVFRDVDFISASLGWAVGEGGAIFATSNGGSNWAPQPSGTEEWLWDVEFWDESHGCIVGNNVILYTNDGGSHWNQAISPEGAFRVQHISSQTLYAVSWSSLLESPDGCVSWSVQSKNVTNEQLRGLYFLNAQEGWVVTAIGRILHTVDGAASWTNQREATFLPLERLQFLNGTTGFAVGSNTFLRTTNGGQTWEMWLASTYFSGLHFVDPNTGWIVGSNGTIWKTLDAGKSWASLSGGVSKELFGVQFVGPNTGWVVGDGVIIKSIDAGSTWTVEYDKVAQKLQAVGFADPLNGWAIGEFGTALQTVDGGNIWIRRSDFESSPLVTHLYDIDWVDSQHGWIVGRKETPEGFFGAVWRTLDGGNSWQTIIVKASNGLLGVDFIDTQNGWAVAWGVILHTTDGGLTWSVQDSTPSSSSFVYMLNSSEGWAGTKGIFPVTSLFHTTNGGLTWGTKELPDHSIDSCFVKYDVGHIQFIDIMHGYAVGDGATVLVTDDGGASWSLQDLPWGPPVSGIPACVQAPTIRSLYFVDAQKGWLVGQKGAIFNTSNGGASWTNQESGYNINLNDVHFLSQKHGFAVGDHGLVLRSLPMPSSPPTPTPTSVPTVSLTPTPTVTPTPTPTPAPTATPTPTPLPKAVPGESPPGLGVLGGLLLVGVLWAIWRRRQTQAK